MEQKPTPVVENQNLTENLTENSKPQPLEENKSEDDPKHENWIPPEKRRPEDEFFDLKSVVVLREEDVLNDGTIIKLVVEEGKGASVDKEDIVYYMHETRFDNGQLVDLQEMRRVPQKFQMNDQSFHEFYRHSIFTMRKGEVSFLKLSPAAHHNMFRSCGQSFHRTPEEKEQIR